MGFVGEFEKVALEKEALWKELGLAAMIGLAPHHAKAKEPTPEILSAIQSAAQRNNIDPSKLEGLVFTESSFDPGKINREKGAPIERRSMGLAQVQPRTAKGLGFKGTPNDLMKVDTNLDYSAKYLSRQLKRYKGDYSKALSAYNAGHAITGNKDYVQKILRYKR